MILKNALHWVSWYILCIYTSALSSSSNQQQHPALEIVWKDSEIVFAVVTMPRRPALWCSQFSTEPRRSVLWRHSGQTCAPRVHPVTGYWCLSTIVSKIVFYEHASLDSDQNISRRKETNSIWNLRTRTRVWLYSVDSMKYVRTLNRKFQLL